MRGNALPLCSICCEMLGKYGGPITLPCGHNGCLQCMASARHSKQECPLCRAPFPKEVQLAVNHELRDLVTLAAALHTVDQDGWQTVVAGQTGKGREFAGEGALDSAASMDSDVALVPTAPPMHVSLHAVRSGQGDLLSLETPMWLPDSHAAACRSCEKPFQPFRRARHHCRLCGQIFCHACSQRSLLLPPKFQEHEPQRCCSPCAELLEPLQPFLAGTISQAVQPAVHDLTDNSVARSWLNNPLSGSLATDIYKATNIVRSFAQVGRLQPERGIPAAVLRGAAGFAILSVLKAGMGWSGAVGTGLVVVRRPGDAATPASWSAPSALGLVSLGWGFQAGGALHDLLIVLRNQAAVQAFCGSVHAGLGGNASLAVGPLGRQADAVMRMGTMGAALCYSYSCSRGAYAGIGVEGTLIYTRGSINSCFYGRSLPAWQLLTEDSVAPPAAARPLYAALEEVLAKVELPLSVAEASRPPLPAPQSPAAHRRPITPDSSEGYLSRGRSVERGTAEPDWRSSVAGARSMYSDDGGPDNGMMGDLFSE